MQPGDVYRTYADVTELEREFGFSRDMPLEEGEYFCLIMEYIRGGSLKERKNLSADEFLKIAWRLSGALVYLHTGDKPVL